VPVPPDLPDSGFTWQRPPLGRHLSSAKKSVSLVGSNKLKHTSAEQTERIPESAALRQGNAQPISPIPPQRPRFRPKNSGLKGLLKVWRDMGFELFRILHRHRLRAAFATLVRGQRVDHRVLQAYMGHAPTDVFGAHYEIISVERMHSEIIPAVEEFLRRKTPTDLHQTPILASDWTSAGLVSPVELERARLVSLNRVLEGVIGQECGFGIGRECEQ